jgi:biotin carboxyl carrier protein
MKLHVTVAGREVPVEIEVASGAARAVAGGESFSVSGGKSGVEVIVHGATMRTVLIALPGRPGRDDVVRLQVGGRIVEARVLSERDKLRALAHPPSRKRGLITANSTLPGIIRRILLSPGDPVEEGTPILTLEAMKMENEVRAEARGRIRSVLVEEGQIVNAGDALAEIEAGEDLA